MAPERCNGVRQDCPPQVSAAEFDVASPDIPTDPTKPDQQAFDALVEAGRQLLRKLGPDRTLKVGTLNTYGLCFGPYCLFYEKPHRTERMKQIGERLRTQRDDVVFLQEISSDADFKYYQEAGGYDYGFYVPESDIAILSHYPLAEAAYQTYRWQGSTMEDCMRGPLFGLTHGFMRATLDFHGTPILLVTMHPPPRSESIPGFGLSADAISPERVAQFTELREALREHQGLVIMGGDMNTGPGRVEFDILRKYFNFDDTFQAAASPCVDGAQVTFDENNRWVKDQGIPGEGRIDHILVSREILTEAACIPKIADLSDHYPYQVTLRIPDQEAHLEPPVRRGEPKEELALIAGLNDYFWDPNLYQEKLFPLCKFSGHVGHRQFIETRSFLNDLYFQLQTAPLPEGPFCAGVFQSLQRGDDS